MNNVYINGLSLFGQSCVGEPILVVFLVALFLSPLFEKNGFLMPTTSPILYFSLVLVWSPNLIDGDRSKEWFPSGGMNFLVSCVDLDIKDITENSFCIPDEKSISEALLEIAGLASLAVDVGDNWGDIEGDTSGEPPGEPASFPPVIISIYFSGARLGSGIVSISKALAWLTPNFLAIFFKISSLYDINSSSLSFSMNL